MSEKKPFENPESTIHRELAQWALDCAERTLPLFEEYYLADKRPRRALETLQAWIEEKQTMVECRQSAFGAHAAAREATEMPAVAAARAAGQAASVAHMFNHSPYAAEYALKAIGLSVPTAESEQAKSVEREWQWDHLRGDLRTVGFPKGK